MGQREEEDLVKELECQRDKVIEGVILENVMKNRFLWKDKLILLNVVEIK